MKSLLFQPAATVLVLPPDCEAGRRIIERVIADDQGFFVTMKVRDKIIPEDPYLRMARAFLFSVAEGTVYPGVVPNRATRDALIKDVVVLPVEE